MTAAPVRAGDPPVEVRMLNRDPDDRSRQMVFAPDLIQVPPGTTVRFLPVDRGHNTASTKGMLPEGAEAWQSSLNAPYDVTLTVEGTYGYHCTPHLSMGMVGLILVGDARANFHAAREVRQRGRAAERYAELFARAEALLEMPATD